MKHLVTDRISRTMPSREEFQQRFARDEDAPALRGVVSGDMRIDCESVVWTIVGGSLYVEDGATIIFRGVVGGDMTVSPKATAWVDGVVRGTLNVQGAAFVSGVCGKLIAASDALIGNQGVVIQLGSESY